MSRSHFSQCLIVLGSICLAFSSEYRFFQIEKHLFATNGTSYWFATNSEADPSGKEAEPSGVIRLTLMGPHKLIGGNSSVLNFTKSPFKFVFVARLDKKCTVLALIDEGLNYEFWQIRVDKNKNISQVIRQFMSPLETQSISSSKTCQLGVPETSNLQFLPQLKELFTTNTTVTSILSTGQNKVLYFLTENSYLKVNPEEWKFNANRTAEMGSVLPVPVNGSLPHKNIVALYSPEATANFVLVRSSNGTRVCTVTSLPLMHFGRACKLFTYFYPTKLARSFEFGLGQDDYKTTAESEAKGISTLLIMVVSVVVLVTVLLLFYLLAAKCLCQEPVVNIPFSSMQSNTFGKLKTTSSIKTLKSYEVGKRQGKARK